MSNEAGSFSGQDALVEGVLMMRSQSELANARFDCWRASQEFRPFLTCVSHNDHVLVPEGHKTGGVPREIYNGYRRGLVGACADIVITTVLPDGLPAVLAIKRGRNACFAGKWWMQGGAVPSYVSLHEFVKNRAEKECGVRPEVEALIGVFRTVAEDKLADTIQPCYVGFAPYEQVNEKFKPDGDHDNCRLMTLRDLRAWTGGETLWYPHLCFLAALRTMRHHTSRVGDGS